MAWMSALDIRGFDMLSKTVASIYLPLPIQGEGSMKKPDSEYVSVEPFQKEFLKLQARDGFTLTDLARRLGWFETRKSESRPRPDATRVSRLLGINAKGNHSESKRVEYENAVLLCRALDLWPVDCNI